MFQIVNNANHSEINIIGSIGEGFFEEGITFENVKSQFDQIQSDVVINLSSLGGDLIEALAIHDMFKAFPYNVTTNIMGATASAGTIIALGGDHIKISENSMFLGHRASQMAAGNADDLRAAANDLDKFDSRLIAIYKSKTKKPKQEIESWLKEDKWITAKEAKEFGLVDEVYKSKKVLNSIEELEAIKPLPENFKQPEMENNDKTIINSILNAMGVKNDASLKAENEALRAELEELKGKVTNSVEPSKITELEGVITNKTTELDSIKAELDALKVTNDANEAEIARLTAKPTNVEGNDPSPDYEGQEGDVYVPRFLPKNEALKNYVQNITKK